MQSVRTGVQTEVVQENLIPVSLHLLPQLPLSIRIPDGGHLLGAVQSAPSGRQITAASDLQTGDRLRNLYRRGGERKVERVLREVEAVLPEALENEWRDWQAEWAAASEGRESVRLVVLSTLFFRVLYPAQATQSGEAQAKCQELINLLWEAIQQLLPQGRWAKDFITLAHTAWLENRRVVAERRPIASLGQILAEMMLVPLSEDRSTQLNQWIDGMMRLPATQTDRQLFYCVILLRYLRDVALETADTAQRHNLARRSEELEALIASRLAEGQTIDAFLDLCSQGLIEEEAIKKVCEQLNLSFDQARRRLHNEALLARQKMQASRDHLVAEARNVERQNETALSQDATLDRLNQSLREEQEVMQRLLLDVQPIAVQDQATQARLLQQIHRIGEEGKRL